MFKQLLLLLVALVSTLSATHYKVAKPGEFPYHVSIQVTFNGKDYEHYCGGVIVSSQYVLTAAHCVRYDKGIYRVVAGSVKLNGSFPYKQTRQPKRFIQDPDYSIINDFHLALYDIALIHLNAPFSFNRFISSINTPRSGSQPKGNATLLGWGSNSRRTPDSLRNVPINIPDQRTCSKYYKEYKSVSHICVYPVHGACSCITDNGAVLIQGRTVVAVGSFNGYPCDSRAPIIYTKVSSAIPYIATYMKI